jgi:hypothetical protein
MGRRKNFGISYSIWYTQYRTLSNVIFSEIYVGPHNILLKSFLFWLKVTALIASLANVGAENQANCLSGKSDSHWLKPDSPICASQ